MRVSRRDAIAIVTLAMAAALAGTVGGACSSTPPTQLTTVPTPEVTKAVAQTASHRVLKLAELNTEQIRALDKDKTIVFIPGGILEEHGPHLPSFTDGYRNEWATADLARTVADHPGWTALVLPTIPLGFGGANQIGGHFSFPGTYSVRYSTMRAIFVDIGSELGDQGFKWIFMVHMHGAPRHNRAMDEAGDYFRDTYGGRMVNIYGVMPVMVGPGGGKPIPPAEAAENGMDVHAGRFETSSMLFVRPDLVAPSYRSAPSYTGSNWDELIGIAEKADWPGYFGAPKYATAAEGKERSERRNKHAADIMWRIVDGTADERVLKRYSQARGQSPTALKIAAAQSVHERKLTKRFDDWLARREANKAPPK